MELTGPTPADPSRVGDGLSVPRLSLVAVAAFGGPLALAALYAPLAVEDVTGSGGAIAILATAAFLAPLAIWLRFSRDIASAGGLTAFVEAAVGRRIALVQAALWVGSYALYLLYTSAYIAYDILPVAWPGAHQWRALIATVLPALVAASLVAGRRVAVTVIGVLAVTQVALLVVLDVVAVRHAPGAAAFHLTATSDTGRAAGGIATLFVCGSLPLFLGGEVRGGGLAFRRVLPPAFALAGVGMLLAIYPLARDPAFAHAPIPGVSLVRVDVGHVAGTLVGLGVAGSILAVMLIEYVALTRLLHYVSGTSVTTWVRRLAVALVVVGPVSLAFHPERFYDRLLKPSLVLLWLAQLVVVAVFPIYLYRRSRVRVLQVVLTVVAVAIMLFGLVDTLVGSSST